MRDRLKVLDCNRKAVLGLPPAAFKLWMTYYMNEDDSQESWMSIPELEAQSGLSRHTVVDKTEYLLRTGWLVDTGKTAADKWIQMGKTPTHGSYQVHVYRVDDPTSAKFALEEKANDTGQPVSPVQNFHQCRNFTSAEFAPKVLGSIGLGLSLVESSLASRSGNVVVGVEPSPTTTPPNSLYMGNSEHGERQEPKNQKTLKPSSMEDEPNRKTKTCWTHGLPLPCRECYRGRDREAIAHSRAAKPDAIGVSAGVLAEASSKQTTAATTTPTARCPKCGRDTRAAFGCDCGHMEDDL